MRLHVDPYDEARGGPVQVSVTNDSKESVVLARAVLLVERDQASTDYRSGVLGEELEGTIVTLSLVRGPITEEIGMMEARAPMVIPPEVREVGSRSYERFRVLGPGESIRLTLDVPGVLSPQVRAQVSVEGCPLKQIRDAGVPLHAPAGEDVEIEVGPAHQTGVTLSVGRWAGLRDGAMPSEVLASQGTLEAFLVELGTLEGEIPVTAAPYPSPEALARAEIGPGDVEKAVFVPSRAQWIFELRDESCLVQRDGDVRRHAGGKLVLLGKRLARTKGYELAIPISVLRLDEARWAKLADKGFPLDPTEKVPSIACSIATLPKLLEALEDMGLVILDEDIRPRPAPAELVEEVWESDPWARMEQGTEMNCVECTTIQPGLADCPDCRGSGRRFQAARMADESVQRGMGQASRAEVDEERTAIQGLEGDDARQAHRALAATLKKVLTEASIYGPSYAAAYEGRQEILVDSAEAAAIADALVDALRTRLRLEILEARARAGAQ